MTRPAANDYSSVTELPGARASRQQLAKLRQRYELAAEYASGRDVLEVGCGAGLGLGMLARRARRVVGADSCSSNLGLAQGHYHGRVPLLRCDAAALPFRAASFDVVLLLEALYYLRRPGEFVADCARVLRPGGIVVLATVNPAWVGFHPSPLAERYFDGAELEEFLSGAGLSATILGGFPETAGLLADRLRSRLKRIGSRAGLIPATMRGKEPLKRLIFGALEALPAEIHSNGSRPMTPIPIDPALPAGDYTVLYALGRLHPQS